MSFIAKPSFSSPSFGSSPSNPGSGVGVSGTGVSGATFSFKLSFRCFHAAAWRPAAVRSLKKTRRLNALSGAATCQFKIKILYIRERQDFTSWLFYRSSARWRKKTSRWAVPGHVSTCVQKNPCLVRKRSFARDERGQQVADQNARGPINNALFEANNVTP